MLEICFFTLLIVNQTRLNMNGVHCVSLARKGMPGRKTPIQWRSTHLNPGSLHIVAFINVAVHLHESLSCALSNSAAFMPFF